MWSLIATSIYGVAAADTGAGGLFNASSSARINGWYTDSAPEDARMPYVVATLVSAPEEYVFQTATEMVEVVFQVTAYMDKQYGVSALAAVTDRVRTLFRRVAISVTGYTAGQIFIDAQDFQSDTDQAKVCAYTMRVFVSK